MEIDEWKTKKYYNVFYGYGVLFIIAFWMCK
jgi:hypothetical protein